MSTEDLDAQILRLYGVPEAVPQQTGYPVGAQFPSQFPPQYPSQFPPQFPSQAPGFQPLPFVQRAPVSAGASKKGGSRALRWILWFLVLVMVVAGIVALVLYFVPGFVP